ncbi:MAG TPA: aldehyde dehydrogenase family protein [Acidobacteriota bacterium]|nr:aldehyde dehydrogenase family protein [Acidobacteriota bacterium]
MEKYKMWIDGKWCDADSGKTYRTYNPANGEVIAEVPLAGHSDVDKAVAAARKAFKTWSKRIQEERSEAVLRIAAAMKQHKDELVRLEILEHGATARHAPIMIDFAVKNLELAAAAARVCMGYMLPVTPSKGAPPGMSNTVVYMKREPFGVCALITPWNVPTLLIATKIGPCIATGNTCVIKPPSINSGIALKIAEIISRVDLPPGIINFVTGPGGLIGNQLSSHPGIDFISFTGSSEVGKDIIAASSRTVKQTMMELGGKNPAIILEDADIDAAAEELCGITFENVGQNCAQPSRFYVHEKVHDRFVEKFVETANKIKIGDPSDPDTVMGPVVSQEQRDSVERYIKIAIDEGGKLECGGRRPEGKQFEKGYYLTPTVFSGLKPDMTIAREEVFGPVVGFFKFNNDESAIEAANDSVFGLCASVWTRDYARGLKFVNELQAGSVWINQHMNLVAETPWGGFKESGLMKEGGVIGPEGYTQLKYVCIKHN